jgi:type I restriction enzyme, S subunit
MTYKSYKIGELCSLVRGTSPTMKTVPGEYPLVVTASYRRTSNSFQLEGPAVCVPLISSTGHGHASLHRVHYQEGRFGLANLLVALLPKDPKVCNAKYLYHLLMAKKDEYFVPLMLGTANVSLKEDDIAGVQIPLPPIEEQHRTVARIEELGAKIEEAYRIRRDAEEESENLEPVALSHIFDYDRGETLPKAWRWLPFVALLSDRKNGMITGPFGTLLRRADVLADGTPILGISNVEANRFVPGFKDFIASDKADELANYRLEPEDIVIARSGTVGRSCLIPEGLEPKPLMSTNLIRVRLNKQIFLPTLLCMLFNGSKLVERHKDSECRGSSRAFFTQKILFKLEVPTPPIEEQLEIISYLENLRTKTDSLKEMQTETSAALKALMPSILDRAFRGEL